MYGLNSTVKRHRVAGLIKKRDPTTCFLQETHFSFKDTQTQNEGMEEDIPCKWKPQKVGITILISDKIDLKPKTITRSKESHYVMIKGVSKQEFITIIKMYGLKVGTPKYMTKWDLSLGYKNGSTHVS